MSKVSIIVPYLNGISYLEECVECIEGEQLEDFEIVLVHDKAGQKVPENIRNKPYVTYICLEDGDLENSTPFGVAAARNIGMEKAIGEYIYFFDSDDYIITGALQKLLTLAEDKNASLVTGNKAGIWFRKKSFDWDKAEKESEITGIHPLEGEILKERFKAGFSVQHLLLRRDFVLEHELTFPQDNTFYSDASFVVAALVAAQGSAWLDGDSYYIWRHHNDPIHLPALSQMQSKTRAEEFMDGYQACLNVLEAQNIILRELADYHLCDFLIRLYPEQITGATKDRATTYLQQLPRGFVKKWFSTSKQVLLHMLKTKKYGLAKLCIKINRAWHKKMGVFGAPIQYFRMIDKVFFRHLKVKENWIFIESFFGKYYNDSPKYLYEHLLETRGDKYRYILCVNQKTDKIKGNPTIVKYFSLRYVYYTTRCKYQIYNGRQPQWLQKREGQVLLETWHGTPLKKLVFDLDDVHAASRDYKSILYRLIRDWDYLISDNPFSTDVFERAFDYPRERILEYGYPRNDILYAKNREDIAKEVKRELKIPEGKRVILYAPTWRDNQFYDKGKYKFSLEMDLERLYKEFGDNSVLLLRVHYHIADQLDCSGLEEFVYNGNKYEDISLLYLISDICITDYSSVFFDYANLRRPILFFAYDYADYKDELRGLYISMEDELPGPILQTNDELVDALHHIDDISKKYEKRYNEFYERFCSVDDGHASERIVDKVFGRITE